MASRAMAAAFAGFFCFRTGSAAAGIAKFLWGRAGIPVAGRAGAVLVGFTARAGVFGSRIVLRDLG